MTRASSAANEGRRAFLRSAGSATLGLTVAACAARATEPGPERPVPENDHEEAEVTPGEDLMQEHGVLERILLVYDEAARRIEAGEQLDVGVVATGADIVRRFVEDYHEKQEEEFVFPRLQQAKREADLVLVLLRQHQRGRELTDEIVRLAKGPASPELRRALLGFVRMYRPHAAREETVLFPAFREVVGRSGYGELGEQFEEREHQRFGEHGFDDVVAQVAELERKVGLDDLSTFTPS